jgi:fatty-acyl-CoA synthase
LDLIKTIVFQSRFHESEPAIAFPGGIATYGALMKAIASSVDALRTFDLPAGSAVMLDIRNPIHHTAMIFALALLGLPSSSVGTAFVADKSGFLPALFLTDRADIQVAGVRNIRVDERWFASDAASRPHYQKLLALPGFPSPQSVVRYVYSSGTTGYPKCVALTEENLERRQSRGAMTRSWWMSGPAALNMMGFSTIMGISMPVTAHLAGALLCYAGSPTEALQMIQVFRVSALIMSVGQLQAFYKIIEEQRPPVSLKLLAVVGAKVTQSFLTEARARICDMVAMGYGSTEMGGVSASFATEIGQPEGYAGYVLPWATLEVVDDDRRPVAPGVEGTFRVRTDELAYYVDSSGRPMEMLEDGWFYPGDIGSISPDGEVIVTGRSTEVINRGGIIVAPEVIEEVLRLDKRVTDVAVVGVPNELGVEEIWAGVVSDTLIDPGAIAEAARPHLNEKVPDRIIQISTIPRAESAKIKRGELREMLRRKVQGL